MRNELKAGLAEEGSNELFDLYDIRQDGVSKEGDRIICKATMMSKKGEAPVILEAKMLHDHIYFHADIDRDALSQWLNSPDCQNHAGLIATFCKK